MVNHLECWMADTDVLLKNGNLQFYRFRYSPNFCHLVTDKIIQCDLSKGFLWKNAPKLLHIEDFTKKIPWNCHIWTMGSSRLPKYSRILNFFYFHLGLCSQIWLIPLVDDLQCGYITKLEKKKPYHQVGEGSGNKSLPCWGGQSLDRKFFFVEFLSNNE
jgi:hypothetical protein